MSQLQKARVSPLLTGRWPELVTQPRFTAGEAGKCSLPGWGPGGMALPRLNSRIFTEQCSFDTKVDRQNIS